MASWVQAICGLDGGMLPISLQDAANKAVAAIRITFLLMEYLVNASLLALRRGMGVCWQWKAK